MSARRFRLSVMKGLAPYSNNIIQTYLDAYGAAAALINGVSPAGF